MRSDTTVFCDRVRALKNPNDCFQSLKISEKQSAPASSRPTRLFHLSHTIYAQVYPQVVRCNTLKNALSCSPREKKPYIWGFSLKNQTRIRQETQVFSCFQLVNQTYFRKPKPHVRMAPFFQARTARTVRVLQSKLAPLKGIRFRAQARNQKLRQGSGLISLFPTVPKWLCPTPRRL